MIGCNIDLTGLDGLLDVENIVQQEVAQANLKLGAMAHAHAVELATNELHSRRETYLKALSFFEADGVAVLQLDASATWIEDGMCVVYGKNDKHIPSILTPDGWVKITDVKVGMMVLNRFNKWTSILKIHDNSLFDYCEEVVDEEATAALRATIAPVKYDHHKGTGKRSQKRDLVVKCPSCGGSRTTSRFAFTDGSHPRRCSVCLTKKELVSFTVERQGFERTITLTADHTVFTQRGEVLARDLVTEDVLLSPAWGKCGWCEKKVAFGGEFCTPGCATSFRHDRNLSQGTHVSQRPDWKSNYYKNLGKKKVSNVEDVVEKLIEARGQSVCYYGDGEADWLRQYRVPSTFDSKGRQKYYFIDFYNSKLKLALELDGHFHFTTEGLSKDRLRDERLAGQGISVVRIPVAALKSGEFEKKILPALIANHSSEMELVPTRIRSLKKFCPTRSYPMDRRWDITVAEGESYVCNGVLIHNSPHNMLDALLSSPKAKVSKDGKRYLVIPFDHSPGHGATNTTPAQLDLVNTVKSEMKRRRIPWAKIERDDNGRPLLGRLHKFSVNDAPLKTHHGPGQGRGPVGDVRQGPNVRQVVGGGPAGGGTPFLAGVGVYQKMEGGAVKRSVMTFRVASEDHVGEERWQHPGLDPKRFLERTEKWAMEQAEHLIVPDLMERLVARI